MCTEDGGLYSCGGNTHGECGIGKVSEAVTNVTKVNNNQPIICVAAGATLSLFISKLGDAQLCGKNEGISQEHADNEVVLTPTKISNQKYTFASAGVEHALLITMERKLYGCGRTTEGQLSFVA